jgi:hypothetical protein
MCVRADLRGGDEALCERDFHNRVRSIFYWFIHFTFLNESALRFLWVQECDLQPQTPGRAVGRMDSVAVNLKPDVDRLGVPIS